MDLLLNTGQNIQVPTDITISDLSEIIGSNNLLWNDTDIAYFVKKKILNVNLEPTDLDLPFYQIYEKYVKKNNVNVKSDHIEVFENLEIKCHKTTRVLKDTNTSSLPPSFGTYQIENLNDNLHIRMKQTEAMWISFSPKHYHQIFAIKVDTGNINAITGKISADKLDRTDQNYLSIPRQPWIDGVNVRDGFIQQFGIMGGNNMIRLHIHQHLEETYGNLDTYVPELEKFGHYRTKPSDLDLKTGSKIFFSTKSEIKNDFLLRDIGVKSGDRIEIRADGFGFDQIQIYIMEFSGRITPMVISKNATISDIKMQIQIIQNILVSKQRLIFNHKLLLDQKPISTYNIRDDHKIYLTLNPKSVGNFSIANRMQSSTTCGGFIRQELCQDNFTSYVTEYSETYAEVVLNIVAEAGDQTAPNYDRCAEQKLPWFNSVSDTGKQTAPNYSGYVEQKLPRFDLIEAGKQTVPNYDRYVEQKLPRVNFVSDTGKRTAPNHNGYVEQKLPRFNSVSDKGKQTTPNYNRYVKKNYHGSI